MRQVLVGKGSGLDMPVEMTSCRDSIHKGSETSAAGEYVYSGFVVVVVVVVVVQIAFVAFDSFVHSLFLVAW